MEKIRRMFGVQDMTVGDPLKKLAAFCIPVLLGNFAQQLYNTVDSIIVGKCVGDHALAAVGAVGPIMNLLLLLYMGIATGAGILISQYFGARNWEKLTKAVGTCLTLSFFSGLIIMAVGPFLARPMMELLKTPPEVLDMSVRYMVILCLGIQGCGYYNIVSGILRGMGDTVSPLMFLILTCVLNGVLDWAFVALFHMGVAGVALATVIAQAISAVMCLWKLRRMKDIVHLNRKALVPDRELVKKTVSLGLPSGLSQMIFAASSIVVQKLTNSFGPQVMACSIVVMRVDGFAMMPNFTFGTAMTTFVGQNVGAQKPDRVKEGVRTGLKAGVCIAVVLVACILTFGEALMGLFTNTAEVVSMSMHMMRILSPGYIAMAITQSLYGVMRGAGDTLTPMCVAAVTTVILRMPLAYLFAAVTGSPDSLFYSLMIAWVLGAAITSVLYKRGAWRRKAEKSRRAVHAQ